MREFSRVSSTFWTGETGRELRRLGPEAQVVALYLITAPGSNMIGLYYLPLPILYHETGLSAEGALKALRSLSEVGFAHHDADAEVVWVPEMAFFQLGDTLSPKDNRHKAVLQCLKAHHKCRFFNDFHEKYKSAFQLPDASPSEGPSKPLRSKEKEKEKEKNSLSAPASAGPGKEGSSRTQKPTTKRKPNPLFDAIAEVCGADPAVNGGHVGKVAAVLAKADPPYTADEVRAFGNRFHELCTWAMGDGRARPELGELQNHIGKLRVAKKLRGDGPKPPVEFGRQPPME